MPGRPILVLRCYDGDGTAGDRGVCLPGPRPGVGGRPRPPAVGLCQRPHRPRRPRRRRAPADKKSDKADKTARGKGDKEDEVHPGAAAGTAAGAAIGAVGMGAVSAGLSGASGAAAGGLAGALIALGLSGEDARCCEGEVRKGRTLVTVDAGNRAGDARGILRSRVGVPNRAASVGGQGLSQLVGDDLRVTRPLAVRRRLLVQAPADRLDKVGIVGHRDGDCRGGCRSQSRPESRRPPSSIASCQDSHALTRLATGWNVAPANRRSDWPPYPSFSRASAGGRYGVGKYSTPCRRRIG